MLNLLSKIRDGLFRVNVLFCNGISLLTNCLIILTGANVLLFLASKGRDCKPAKS